MSDEDLTSAAQRFVLGLMSGVLLAAHDPALRIETYNDDEGLDRLDVVVPLMAEGWRRWRVHVERIEPGNPWHEWPHRTLEDGRLLALEPLLFDSWRLHVVRDEHDSASTDIYDFQDHDAAVTALQGWSGEGEPEGWYRHKPSNRRRPDGDPTKEYMQP